MSSYTSPLIITPRLDGKTWIVLREFRYYLYFEGGPEIIVKPGFVTDFASIPKFLWWLLPQWDTYGKAAVLHDWLYAVHTLDGYTYCNRKLADLIFKQAMRVSGTKEWKVQVIYWAVRLCGWHAWWKRRKVTLETDVLNNIKWG